jgi:hypothetical protein
VTRGIAWGSGLRAPSSEDVSTVSTEESIVRHALVTIQLMKQARNAAIAEAEANQRSERQAGVTRRTEPDEPGRLRVATLARRVRVLGARTT